MFKSTQTRSMFKPSLKHHSLHQYTSVPLKRFSFLQSLNDKAQNQTSPILQHLNSKQDQNLLLEDKFDQNYDKFLDSKNQNKFSKNYDILNYNGQNQNQLQRISKININKFDPILPKFIFKGFFDPSQTIKQPIKQNSNKLIQQLKVNQYNYPYEVQKLMKQTLNKKIKIKQAQNKKLNKMQEQQQLDNKNWKQNSYKQSMNAQANRLNNLKSSKKEQIFIGKLPYFPLMGTDGVIYWSHSVDKIILWRYKNNDYCLPEVFCILNLQKQHAPISVVYCKQVTNTLFKNQNVILIAVALFNQIKFFSFNLNKYQKQYTFHMSQVNYPYMNQNNQEINQKIFYKYIDLIMIKAHSRFLISNLIIQIVPSLQPSKNKTRPLIIFNDGGKDIQIVDLQRLTSYKTYNKYSMDYFYNNILMKKNKKIQLQNQNQIIKLLHYIDQTTPEIHYIIVLRKQTKIDNQNSNKNGLMMKIKKLLSRNKFSQVKQNILINIYEWNQKDTSVNNKSNSLFNNPKRINKLRQITSKQLQNKLKLTYFEFFKFNLNTQFIIADISLIEKKQQYKILPIIDKNKPNKIHYLKVTFTNGTYIIVNNLKNFNIMGKIKVNANIEKQLPIVGLNYRNYRKILDKAKYLLPLNDIKKKFNYYIYQQIQGQKEVRYSLIDPVVSQSNGLCICENKIIYQNQLQIQYNFTQTQQRKVIYESRQNKLKKNFIIFENSHLKVIQPSNFSESLLILSHLNEKYRKPQNQFRLDQYLKQLFNEYSESMKIQILFQIINLLIQIQSLGKTQYSSFENQIIGSMMNKFLKKDTSSFDNYQYDQKIHNQNQDIDQTTYLEDDHKNMPKKEKYYVYKVPINKKAYNNFIQYLFQTPLNNSNSKLQSSQGKLIPQNFKILINDNNLQFIQKIFIEQGSKLIQKPLKYSNINQRAEINNKISSIVQKNIENSNDRKYLISIFTNIIDLNENYLQRVFSKIIVLIIQDFIDLSYTHYCRIKSKYLNICEKFQQIQHFILQFTKYCTIRQQKYDKYQQTIIYCNLLKNSLPKISLIMRLFDIVSQLQDQNIELKRKNKQILNFNQITLKNLLFQINKKQIFARILVESLFEDNSILLDEVQQKLPQIQIKYYRYFAGWKRMNKNILQSSYNLQLFQKNQQTKNHNNSGFFLNLFSSNNNKDFTSIKSNNFKLMENQQIYNQGFNNIQERIRKQQLGWIKYSLNQFTYSQFEKYFLIKGYYYQYIQILLQKLQFLQQNYQKLKNKYHFEQNKNLNFSQFYKRFTINLNYQQKQFNKPLFYQKNIHDRKQQDRYKQNLFNNFLKFQQEAYNYQRFFKTSQLIKYFNFKLLQFINRIFDNFKEKVQKDLSQLNPIQRNQKNKINSLKLLKFESQSKRISQDLKKQINNILNLIDKKGSNYLKKQIRNKLNSSQLFKPFIKNNQMLKILIPPVTKLNQNIKYCQRLIDFNENPRFLLKNKKETQIYQHLPNKVITENKQRMFQQKINQKYLNQVQNNTNQNLWMKKYLQKQQKK